MLRRVMVPLILVAAILVATSGLLRLRFDTDILSMLPPELPEVKGLKAFHEAFSRDDELILLIEGGEADEGGMGLAAESLAKHLKADKVAQQARWKPRWNDDPEAVAELLSYLWLNGDPATTQAQAARLAAGASEATLQKARQKVATAMEGMDMVMLAHDPFGFLNHPAVAQLTTSGQGGEAFESPDGRSHLLFIDSPAPLTGYRGAEAWLESVRASIRAWQASDGDGLKVRITGEPAFSAEIGTAMERDLSGSISITLGLIGILFWWMQRRLSLLLGLVGVLVIVFSVALGIAGWLYGSLSIIALSSIEILIGLAVDYGLVICQEAKLARHDRLELRHAAGPPVICGALTTAVVFLALNLGGLPGMAQLGTIVAVGLLAAAAFMLMLYLPYVTKFGVNRQPAEDSGKILPGRIMSWRITAALAVVSMAVLAINGMPGAEFDSKIMRPRQSEAMDAFERVQKAFPTWSDRSIGVVIEADDDAEMLDRIAEARRRIAKAQDDGMLETGNLPDGWWPASERQTANRPTLSALAVDRDRLLREADAAGFTEEALALGRAVLESMEKQVSETALVFPKSEAAREVMRLFLTRDAEGGGTILGKIEPAAGIDPADRDYQMFKEMAGDGIWLSAWVLFKPAVSELVRHDLTRMLVPMFALLVGMMIVIFRRAGDVGRALLAMAVSTLLLLAIMSLTGLKWNFINLMATPLLLGTGIDYAIHVTLSLRRTGGDFKELWNGTGKALLFCGASNVIGFGSLIFSSSDALVSLGVVAVIGILLSMATSIFLLPGWRTR